MISKETLIERFEKFGIPYKENSEKPGIIIGGKFYGYGETPLPSEILSKASLDDLYPGISKYQMMYPKQESSARGILRDRTNSYNK